MPSYELIPTLPDPSYVALVGSAIRWLLQILASVGVTYGAINDQQVMIVAGVIVSLATLGWSFAQKVEAIRRDRTDTIASAQRSANATTTASRPTPIAVVDGKSYPI